MPCAMSRKVITSLLCLAVAGCTTPVPRALPPEMAPKTFIGPVPSTSQLWPESDWWRGFGDANLAALVRQAQENNRDLAAAAARVLQAEAQTSIQRGPLFPQIGATADHAAGDCAGQGCGIFPSGKAFDLRFDATYRLDFWSLARNNLRAANEQLKSARFAQQAVTLTVTANVVNQYLNVLAIRRRIAIAHDNIAAIQAILDVIELRVKAGASSRLDLAREQAQIEFVQAQLPGLESQEKQALYALAVLLGRPPEMLELAARNLDGIAAPAIGAGLPSDLLLRRPDIAQAEANLAAAHANLDAARAAFLPRISLTSSGGFASSAIGTLLQGSSAGYSYGANLLQTIFDGGVLFGRKDLAEATQTEFIANYQATVLDAYADVETALVQVANTNRAEQHLEKLIDAAREAFEISELQYRQGAVDLLTVLQAQQTLFSAQDQLAPTVLANRQSIVRLYVALGGGWSQKPEDRTQFAETEAAPPRRPQ